MCVCVCVLVKLKQAHVTPSLTQKKLALEEEIKETEIRDSQNFPFIWLSSYWQKGDPDMAVYISVK